MFGVPLTVGGTLFQHKETAQGKSYGKSDVGGGFEWSLLQQYL
jgi:hypothetical protein